MLKKSLFLPSKIGPLALVATLVVVGLFSPSVSAIEVERACVEGAIDPTDGWRAVGPAEKRFGRHVPDGRYFEVGTRAAERISDGAKGVIISVYRPNRPPHRVIVAEADAPEFSQPAVQLHRGFFHRGWWSDLTDWIKEAAAWAKRSGGYIRRITDELKNVWDSAKEIVASVKIILETFDEASGAIAEALDAETDARSVQRYAEAIHIENSTNGDARVADRMLNAFRRTASTKKRMMGLAKGIMAIPN
ncbi:MAG: hypothetical protein Q8M16_12245 [Pirellulaceae bacterium]|nr:hypothetical protein [Pirellulaceae bacterium]